MKTRPEFPSTMCIYMILFKGSNLNYIGRTTNLSVRMYQHFSSLKRGVCASKKLQTEYDKHGRSNIIVYIIEHIYDKSLLVDRESFWIKEKDTIKNGLNTAIDNKTNLGKKFTQEHKDRIGKANKGNKRPDVSLYMGDVNRKRIGEKNHFFGKHHSEETKRKISEKNKGRKWTEEQRLKLKLTRQK